MMRLRGSMALPLVLLALAACDSTSAPPDASSPDADLPSRDSGAADAGPVDAGPVDAGPVDAGPVDAGATDAGPVDAGPRDSGPTDGGPLDGGPADAGPIDAGPCADPFVTVPSPPAAPPFGGTAFITDDLITDADPSSFAGLTYRGRGVRLMYDRRPAAFVELNAHLFDARFGSSVTVEVQVNPEFNREQAEAHALFYATAIGRLPAFLFRDVDTVWIHAGMEAFGGGNRNLLIHTAQGDAYVADGSLEEIFVHEAAHASLDAYHIETSRWIEARTADGVAISTYARDNPTREDVAESLGPYLAARFGGARITDSLRDQILRTIPNRVRYLDCLGLTMDVVR